VLGQSAIGFPNSGVTFQINLKLISNLVPEIGGLRSIGPEGPKRTSGNPPVVVLNLVVACRGVVPLPDSTVTHRCVPG